MIWLARHGQTAYNHERRFQGWLPVPLNDTGREQARELGRIAAQTQWGALWCSSLARTVETATIVGEAIGLEPVLDPRFAETDCGDWTDRPFEEVIAEDPEGFEGFATGRAGFRFPGGESFEEQQRRALAGIDDVRAGAQPALVVSHGGTMRLILAHYRRDDALRSQPLANASLVELGP